ncbi:hypothetical protein [Spirosoma validum]|uniref:Uncharacterized protein n=1 Tax=Spirosoma validum TaxID=2771355 RepID=A0A927B084_9BACT|nr:hypothetical protein [Spirosoma validum]MBD2752958.1 hypothetical protein [Spirosoma validum]
MPWLMIDSPDAAWTKQQLTEHLALIAHLLQANAFKPATPFIKQSQISWIALIGAVSDLVRQALVAGKRIDFTEEVNSDDERQDITSLLDSMRQSAYVSSDNNLARPNLTIIFPNLNYVYGVGTGYFPNGLFFRCTYENELTFFVGRDRIFFHRHLMRAFMEARCYLLSLP